MATAANREQHTALRSDADNLLDVAHARCSHDRRRLPINQRVIHAAQPVVLGMAGVYQRTT